MKRGPAPTWIPLRRQLLDSSIWEENAVVCKLWVTLLIVGSEPGRRGTVDMTPRALAARACMSVEDVSAALEVLMAPDPRSRSRAAGGRRVELLDEERSWGWRLVNWEDYERTMAAAGSTTRARARRSGNATECNGTSRNVTEPTKEKDKEKDREKEPREEKELRSSSPSASAPPRSGSPPEAGALGTYFAAWRNRYGVDPTPSKTDIVAANRALMPIDPAERDALVRAFVEDDDTWLCGKAHRLGLLPKEIDRLRAKLAGTLSAGRRRSGSPFLDSTISRDAPLGLDVLA